MIAAAALLVGFLVGVLLTDRAHCDCEDALTMERDAYRRALARRLPEDVCGFPAWDATEPMPMLVPSEN